MNKPYDDDERFETVIDHDGQPRRVLKNGASLRVPLWAMDSVQRSIHDTYSNDLERLRTLRDEAHRERDRRDENAWRGDANKRTCPSCGFDLSEGDLTRAGGDEIDDAASVPHSKHFDLDSARAARQQAYLDLENEQANAWRKGKPQSPNARRDG